MGKQRYSGSRALNFLSGLLAFVVSALMGVAFVALVAKTHDLLSSASFEARAPNGAAPLGWQQQAVVGTWQGKWHGVPSVMVTIDRDGDKLSGTVVFQAVSKSENGLQLTGAPVTLALKEAKFDGKTLRFKLDDQRAAQDLRESGIEMTLTSANQAELRIASSKHGGGWDYEAVTMIKNT